MAPQKKRPFYKSKPFITLLVLLVLGTAAYWLSKKPKTAKVEYQKQAVKRGSINVTITATGVVQPENRLEIKLPVAGRVEKVLVQEGKTVRKGQILAWMSSAERAALLDAAQAKGAEEVKKWTELYKPTPILAPINGTVIARNVEPGQSFQATDAVLVMSDRLTVKAQVDETDIGQIKLKQAATIILDAYPGKNFKASVDQIAFEAKTVNNVTTYIVDTLPEDPPEYLRSGMTANVNFFVAAKDNIVLIPAEAIRNREGKSYALKPNPDDENAPVEQAVELGINDGKRYEVLSGLQEGDFIELPHAKAGDSSQGSNPLSPFGGGPRKPGSGGGRKP